MPVSETDRIAKARAALVEQGRAADEKGYKDTFAAESVQYLRKLPEERMLETLLWLLRDGNADMRQRVVNLKDRPNAQVAELESISKREDVTGSLQDGETDEYLKQHSPSMAKREGRRRP